MKARDWKRFLGLPLLHAIVLAITLLVLETCECLFSHNESISTARVLYCAGDLYRLSLWAALLVLIVETITHALASALARGSAGRMFAVIFDAVVLGSVAGAVLLYFEFQGYHSHEYFDAETGIEWRYSATVFLAAAIPVAIIVFVAEIAVLLTARMFAGRERR